MSYLMVVTTNRISHPDEAFVRIGNELARVAAHHGLEAVGLAMHSAQEAPLARELLGHGLEVIVLLAELKPILATWQPNWVEDLLTLANTDGVYLRWYVDRDAAFKRMPLLTWRMVEATALAVVREQKEDTHQLYVEHAAEMRTPTYRIDPDTYGTTKLKKS